VEGRISFRMSGRKDLLQDEWKEDLLQDEWKEGSPSG